MNQSTHLRRVRSDDRLPDLAQTQSMQHEAVPLWCADRAPLQGDSQALSRRLCRFCRRHYAVAPLCIPSPLRSCITCSGFLSWVRPWSVARTVLNGFPRPSVLEIMLCAPTSSTTARTAPPAIIPVPSTAGFSRTCSPPNNPCTSWGIVPDLRGICTRFFFACCTAFAIATGTSAALPFPIPTHPCPSPTTTSAQKLKRFPPFTTFATRLMKTTLSFKLNSSGFTRTLLLPWSQITVEVQIAT